MQVKVYNDGELVHSGSLEEFLADNDHDEWLVEQCAALESQSRVEFDDFHSGNWVVEHADDKVDAVLLGRVLARAFGSWVGTPSEELLEDGGTVIDHLAGAEVGITGVMVSYSRDELDAVSERQWATACETFDALVR